MKKEETHLLETFSTNLKNFRLAKNISQEKLAEEINKSKTIISDYENLRKEPGILTVQDIANVLDVSIDDLCGNTPTKRLQTKLEHSCVYAILSTLKHLKARVNVTANSISLNFSKDNDCADYSSNEIIKFFKEYEIIQNLENSPATPAMIKTLVDKLETDYEHLPGLPDYKKDSAE